MSRHPEKERIPEEAGAIDAFMARLAAMTVAPRPPAAEWMWVKAQLLRRWDAEHKVTLPADLLEPVQIAALLAAAAVARVPGAARARPHLAAALIGRGGRGIRSARVDADVLLLLR